MSGLAAHLALLRGQRGAAAGAERAAPTAPAGVTEHTDRLAQRLGGRRGGTGTVVVDTRLPAGTPHGHGRLDAHCLTALARIAAEARAGDVVYVDTETTGLAGGTGTVVFMIGLARFEGTTLALRQIVLTAFAGEQALLDGAAEFLGNASTLVSYNGKSFDLPLLATRCRLAGRGDPFSDREHVDLLHVIRALFARRWADCRLATAERRLLRLTRVDDLPGAEAPQRWFDFIRTGRPDGLVEVALHNRLDVVSLAALAPPLDAALDDPVAWDADLLGVARRYIRLGEPGHALALLARHRAGLARDAQLELARLAARDGNWSLSTSIWEQAAAAGDEEALERLAKYHEHVRRDPSLALAVTARLLSRSPASEAHLHRARRLERKLARGVGTPRGP